MPELSFSLPRSVKQSRRLFAALFASSLLTLGCSSLELADFELCPFEDPYTGEGYCVSTVSERERTIPAKQWQAERRNYIMLSPDSWAKIKNKHYKDCYNQQCKQVLQSVDGIFEQLGVAVEEVWGKDGK